MPLTETAQPEDRPLSPTDAASAPEPTASRDGQLLAARQHTVLIYVALAVLALLPGLLNRLQISFGGALLDAPLQALNSVFSDIRFGSGLRFWLGASGATMMALLLLYPLRKMLARGRTFGSIGTWFHVHMLMGLGGPVLVLYHANFSHGGSNANVALWSMLTIATSGILGFFIYGRASAEFYSVRQQVREQVEAITAVLEKLEGMPPAKRQLIQEMEAFEAELLTPRRGVFASAGARVEIEQRRMRFARAITWLVAQYARATGCVPADANRIRAALFSHLNAFTRIARHASSRSIREQIWARWRLFHLPVFLIMIVAVVLHVRAVWDMEPSRSASTLAPQASSKTTEPQTVKDAGATTGTRVQRRGVAATDSAAPVSLTLPGVKLATPGESRLRGGRFADAGTVRDVGSTSATQSTRSGIAPSRAGTAPALPQAARSIEDLLADWDATQRGTAKSSQTAAKSAAPTFRDIPPVSGPARPAEASVEARSTPEAQPPKLVAVPTPARRTEIALPPAPASQPAPTAPPPAPPIPATVAPTTPDALPPPSDIAPVYAELKRKTEDSPMALGGARRSLTDQIAALKAKMAAKQFFHSESETGFLLSGKHLKLECTQCHAKPLKEEASANPRQCIDCHKKDDVHKGRQPDCASCHTTNRWSQILKRK